MNNYKTTVTAVGPLAKDMADAGMFIVFDDTVPDTVAEVAFTHTAENLPRDMAVGDRVIIADTPFEIVAVGEQANKTFADMGHCTFVFDETEMLPGQVALAGNAFPEIATGDTIEIMFAAS